MGKPVNTSLRHTEGFISPAARKAATSIFNRSFERAATTRGPEGTRSRGTPGNTMNQMGNTGRQNEMNFRQGHSGSFQIVSNVTHERSFNAPSTGGRNFGSSEEFWKLPLALPVDHSAHPELSLAGISWRRLLGAAIHPVASQVRPRVRWFLRVAMGMGGAEAVAKNQRPINKKRIIWSSSCYLLEVSRFLFTILFLFY